MDSTYAAIPAFSDVVSAASNETPACLAPWLENPYGLVSLWDIMLFISGERLFAIGTALESLRTDCMLKCGPGEIPLPPQYFTGPIDSATTKKAIEWLVGIEEQCVTLGMVVSGETAAELRAALNDTGRHKSYQALQASLDNLWGLMRKEIKVRQFIYVTPERLRFWTKIEGPPLFGLTVANAFPSATFDIHEAGLTLAFMRGTASVFHLMRVLEIGLTALGRVFNVSLAHTNWAPAIDQIESQIRDMHKDPKWKALSDCKEQQEFYAQAATYCGLIKDAWRNYTAHARGKFTEEEAAQIFDTVKAFMQKLATRLHE